MRKRPLNRRRAAGLLAEEKARASLQALTALIGEELNRLQMTAPPLLLPAIEPSSFLESHRAAEKDSRTRIETALRRWLDQGKWDGVLPSEEYWLRLRFEHAEFLMKCLATEDADGHLICGDLPGRTRLLDWLLIHSWDVSAERMFAHLDD